MNLRCAFCQTPYTLSRNEMLFGLQKMDSENLSHYDAHCPRCRRVTQIPRQRMEMAFPNWREALQEAANAPAAPAPVAPRPTTQVEQKPTVGTSIKKEVSAPVKRATEKTEKPAARKTATKAASKPAAKKSTAKKPAAKAKKTTSKSKKK